MDPSALNWVAFGFAAALASTAVPLVQEHHKADGFGIAVWAKVTVVALSLPFVLMSGVPDNFAFYVAIIISSLLWCVSDVVYFRAVPEAGAGVISRLLPISVIFAFPLWFVFDPDLLTDYLTRPWQLGMLCAILGLATFFAMQMKKCPVSLKALRLIWFVIFAAMVGPLIDKLTLGYAPAKQAPVAFMCIQGAFMILFWGIFALLRKPVTPAIFFAPVTVKAGLMIGAAAALVIYFNMQALALCDHPALLSVVLKTDALWILLYYKAAGRKDDSNVWAGLGIVACAILLVLVKSFVVF
ncbi:MAG: hypothetical protein WC043_09585 [Pseudobdellovibrionaceae bacterium]